MPNVATRLSLLLLLSVTSATAAATDLIYPNGLALDRHGHLFISDVATHRILKLERDGKLTVMAGTGEAGFSGDGGPAIEAQLAAPSDILFDPDGNLLIADTFNHRIRRMDPRGVISTIVGNGKNDYAKGDTPALATSLNNPQGLAIDRDGNLFIADAYNHIVRRVDRNGTVSTFAGTEAGLAGDKGPAVKAQLNLPQAVAVAPDGSVYISDSAEQPHPPRPAGRHHSNDRRLRTRIRRRRHGFGGDGGPADKAKLFSATDLKFNDLGQLYIADSGNNRIRLIAHGVIITIAGSGSPGYSGDGAKALQATLNTPQKIALAPDGSIYIADRVNHRVRKVDPNGQISTVAGGKTSAGIMVDPSVLPKNATSSER